MGPYSATWLGHDGGVGKEKRPQVRREGWRVGHLCGLVTGPRQDEAPRWTQGEWEIRTLMSRRTHGHTGTHVH